MAQDDIITRCRNCGTKNRIPFSRMNDRPICGRCGHVLSTGKIYDQPVNISDEEFDREILQYSGPVLLDCWAPWCGPCRTVGPVLEEIAKENAGRIKIAKLNVDENPMTASKYSIRSIPTIMLFKNGKLVETLVGALPKSEIMAQLRTIM